MLYSPDITAKISAEAAKPDSIFSLNDRMGLILDSVALAKAGFSDTSSMFTLIDGLRGEKECKSPSPPTLAMPDSPWLTLGNDRFGLEEYFRRSCPGDKHLVGERGNPRSGQRIREGERLVVDYSIVYLINPSIQEVYRPLVKRLGFEYPAGEHPSITKLRTESITIAAIRDDKECVVLRACVREGFPNIFRRVIEELRSRFNHLVETGDDSRIPPDLEAITYKIAVKYGNKEQWEFVKGINEAGKTPTSRIAAM